MIKAITAAAMIISAFLVGSIILMAFVKSPFFEIGFFLLTLALFLLTIERMHSRLSSRSDVLLLIIGGLAFCAALTLFAHSTNTYWRTETITMDVANGDLEGRLDTLRRELASEQMKTSELLRTRSLLPNPSLTPSPTPPPIIIPDPAITPSPTPIEWEEEDESDEDEKEEENESEENEEEDDE